MDVPCVIHRDWDRAASICFMHDHDGVLERQMTVIKEFVPDVGSRRAVVTISSESMVSVAAEAMAPAWAFGR